MTEPEIETLIAAFYAAFDNRDGRVPDGAALRAMFADGASITRARPDGVDRWTIETFVAPRIAMLSDGTLTDFHEWETAARTVVLGTIASRQSAYAKAGRLNGADYRGGGDKFIQLIRSDGQWRISAILWRDAPTLP